MYKTLTIGGTDYKLEYSIEASLYANCVKETADLLTSLALASGVKDVSQIISGLSNIPHTALTVFYAGLMEHHGDHPEGDGKVPNISAAKKLLATYIREHSEDETGNFYGVLEICISQMGEDDFFKLTGIAAILENMGMTSEPKKAPKKPTDHQKKATAN